MFIPCTPAMSFAWSMLSTLLPSTETEATTYSGDVANDTAAASMKARPTSAKKRPRRTSSLKRLQPCLLAALALRFLPARSSGDDKGPVGARRPEGWLAPSRLLIPADLLLTHRARPCSDAGLRSALLPVR